MSGGYYGIQGGAGAGGSSQFVVTGEYTGPASYPTGGFVIDLSASYSAVNSIELAVKTVGANLPVAHYEFLHDTPDPGKITVKVMRHRYSRLSSIGNVQNQPASVTVQATAGVSSSAGTSHTHAIDHDHGSFSSGVPASFSVTSLVNVVGPAGYEDHTHALDLPNLTGTSGTEAAHTHADNSIYEHQHSISHVATNHTSVELANATNLSGTIWYLLATGVHV